MLFKVLSIDKLSCPQIWNRETQRKRESGRQASEVQQEKGQQGFRARDKKTEGDIFLLEEQHENFVTAVTK